MGYPGGGVISKSPHMELINNQITHSAGRLGHDSPVKNIPDYPGMITVNLSVTPDSGTGYGAGIGVKKNGIRIKGKPVFRVIGSVNLIGLFKFLNIQAKYDHGIYIPNLVCLGKGENCIGLGSIPVKKKKGTGSAVMSLNGEIYTYREHDSSKYIKKTGTDRETLNFCSGGSK